VTDNPAFSCRKAIAAIDRRPEHDVLFGTGSDRYISSPIARLGLAEAPAHLVYRREIEAETRQIPNSFAAPELFFVRRSFLADRR
jgi:hypothetical protein